MRYFYLLFFIFLSLYSAFSYSQNSFTFPASCAENFSMASCFNWSGAFPETKEYYNNQCTQSGTVPGGLSFVGSSCTATNRVDITCNRDCTCPDHEFITQSGNQCTLTCPTGQNPNTVINNGTPSYSCVDDDPTETPPDECVPPQVNYAGLCRDAEDSPPDCGDTYTTAVFVDGRYVCSNDESCGDGSTPTIYTNEQGSWKVCGSGGDDGNSSEPSGGSSSPTGSTPNTASSTPSTGGGDDGGTGTGSGGGSGSGDGSGNGSGSAASSSSPSGGSGSASSGIGNGGEADASKCENGEPYCDGDPIQCAILVQLWINNCAGYDDVETNNPEDDNEAIQSNFDALISSAEPSVNAEGVLDAMTPGGGNGNGSGSGSGSGTGSGGGNGDGLDLSGLGDAAGSGSGGSCPPDRSIRLGLGTFNVSYQFLCDFAAQISSLVILIFSYIGSIIVYRSLNW